MTLTITLTRRDLLLWAALLMLIALLRPRPIRPPAAARHQWTPRMITHHSAQEMAA